MGNSNGRQGGTVEEEDDEGWPRDDGGHEAPLPPAATAALDPDSEAQLLILTQRLPHVTSGSFTLIDTRPAWRAPTEAAAATTAQAPLVCGNSGGLLAPELINSAAWRMFGGAGISRLDGPGSRAPVVVVAAGGAPPLVEHPDFTLLRGPLLVPEYLLVQFDNDKV